MKKILFTMLAVILFFTVCRSDDDTEDCGIECSLNISTFTSPPPGLTDEELRGLGALPLEGADLNAPTTVPEPVVIPPFEDGFPESAGDVVASDDGTTKDIIAAGGKNILAAPDNCEVCEQDILIANLEGPRAAPAPAPCEFLDDMGNCEISTGRNEGGTSQ